MTLGAGCASSPPRGRNAPAVRREPGADPSSTHQLLEPHPSASQTASGLQPVCAGLSFPTGLAFDAEGTAYLAESGLPFGGAAMNGRGASVIVESFGDFLILLVHPLEQSEEAFVCRWSGRRQQFSALGKCRRAQAFECNRLEAAEALPVALGNAHSVR